MAFRSLLPPRTSTAFMRALEQAMSSEDRLESSIDLIRNAKGRQLPSWLSFLLYEYGLIELTPYVPNPYTLLAEGRLWQIERDTWAAVARGLGWVSSPGSIVEAPARRAWWNSFQIYLDAIPPADAPNLERIEKIVTLSAPFRSDFRRGVSGYDIPPLEGDATKLDGSLLEHESGIRLHAGGPLWSFGRKTEIDHRLTEAEGTALDNWLPPPSESVFNANLVDADAGSPPLSDLIEFTRASPKWFQRLDGTWVEFGINELASTDRGALFEKAATRLCLFAPQFNPLEDDPAAATVDLIGLDDPLGGNEAIRVTFTGNEGRTFLVPAQGLLPATEYSVSFFARLVSASGVTSGTGDAGFQNIFGQLVEGQWVRVIGSPVTTGDIAGQWMDLTLNPNGASLTVDLYGFQVELGSKVTSPIKGPDITGIRAADEITLKLDSGFQNIVTWFEDGSAYTFLGVSGHFDVDLDILPGSVINRFESANSSIWETMTFPWDAANFPWASDAVTLRQIALASWFSGKLAFARFRDANGNVIGYRRCRFLRQVRPDFAGAYSFGSARYTVDDGGISVLMEAQTEAGNGATATAATVDFLINATLSPGVPPGKLWLSPTDLVGGIPIATTTVNLPLRATVREAIKLLLRF